MQLNFIFFFSSRRRHTRWPRDWSSDVCSSDLKRKCDAAVRRVANGVGREVQEDVTRAVGVAQRPPRRRRKIGRASCRDRDECSVVDELLVYVNNSVAISWVLTV